MVQLTAAHWPDDVVVLLEGGPDHGRRMHLPRFEQAVRVLVAGQSSPPWKVAVYLFNNLDGRWHYDSTTA